MIEKQIILSNQSGLHIGTATQFAATANQFEADIILKKGEMEVNGKIVVHLLSLGVYQGDLITLRADGADEREAIDTLYQLIKQKFD